MFNFISFIWDYANRDANTAVTGWRSWFDVPASGWSCAFDHAGMLVYTQRPRTPAFEKLYLEADGGVILGKLFSNNSTTVPTPASQVLGRRASEAIVRSAGKTLIEDYWGAYVAFIRDRQSGRMNVLRDCSGRQPCYRTQNRHVEILFSDASNLSALKLPSFALDLQYLAAFVVDTEIQIQSTGLSGIFEVLAGECVEFQHGAVRQYALWRPASFYRLSRINSSSEALDRLRSCTQNCTNAWSSVFRDIVLRLSGGLDSAIVLGCLAKAPSRPQVTCLNLFSSTPGGDERQYARAAARRADVRLIEHELFSNGPVFDRSLLSMPRSAKPSLPRMMVKLHLDTANSVAREVGADSFWTGQAGDHLFFQTTEDVSAADYKYHHGYRRGFVRALSDAAHLANKPYWGVLQNARRNSRSTVRWNGQWAASSAFYFVSRDVLPTALDAYMAHPWMTDLDNLPIGKQSQICDLARVVHRERPIAQLEFAYEHHPLLSQPLLETCLRIPTFLLVQGGRDRSLARDAFCDLLPTEILEREDKGDITPTIADSLRRDVEFIRETLLGGILMQQGIFKGEALETVLSRGRCLREGQFVPLLACLAVELWARSWWESPSCDSVERLAFLEAG